MDKKRQTALDEIIRKRFRLAKKLKRVTNKELAVYFHVKESTIKQWQQRRVPDNAIPRIAHFFNVEKWVFTDEDLTDEAFEKIILDTTRLEQYRPSSELRKSALTLVKTFKKYKRSDKKAGYLFRSPPFYISFNSVLIMTSVWGAEGVTYTHVLLHKADLEPTSRQDNCYRPHSEQFNIITSDKTVVSDRLEQQDVLNRLKKGKYQIVVFCENLFEIKVYEMNHSLG